MTDPTEAKKTTHVFDQILVESVYEVISDALGQRLTEELTHHLQAYIGLSNDEMQNDLASLFRSLRGSFGVQGDTLSKLIVKKMYQKADIPFYEIGTREWTEYVTELKNKLQHEG